MCNQPAGFGKNIKSTTAVMRSLQRRLLCKLTETRNRDSTYKTKEYRHRKTCVTHKHKSGGQHDCIVKISGRFIKKLFFFALKEEKKNPGSLCGVANFYELWA